MKKITIVMSVLILSLITACGAGTTTESDYKAFEKNIENVCSSTSFDTVDDSSKDGFKSTGDKAISDHKELLQKVEDSKVGENLESFKEAFLKRQKEVIVLIEKFYEELYNNFDNEEKTAEVSTDYSTKIQNLLKDEVEFEYVKDDKQALDLIEITNNC